MVALCLVFPARLLAASPDEMKRHAFETIDRNADQIALLGDSLFYFGYGPVGQVGSGEAAHPHCDRGGCPPRGLTDARCHRPQATGGGCPGPYRGTQYDGGRSGGAAFAVKRIMERYNIPGSVALSLGPAEKQVMSRPYLVRAGNREMMEKFRPEMRKLYLNKPVQFR